MHRELMETAMAAAEAGAEVLRRSFRDVALVVERKGDNDFVTSADRASEAAVLGEIRRRHPDHHILAEEGGGGDAGRAGDRHEWVVDPLDGTTNFLQGLPVFCISVACRRADEVLAGVVIEPLRREVFTAVRGGGAEWNGHPMRVSQRPGLEGAFLATGFPFKLHAALDLYLDLFRQVFVEAKAIRRCGAAALDLAYTAAGVYDGFFEFRLSPWDFAAGMLLVEEAGGRVSDLEGGGSYLTNGNLLAGGPGVHAGLLAAAAKTVDEAALRRFVPPSPVRV